MSIKIGNNNEFSGNNAIGDNNIVSLTENQSWFSRHPLLAGIISSLIVAILTSFWWWIPLMNFIAITK